MPKNSNKKTIPRPLNCFLIYRLEKQREIVAKCAGANHRDISKLIAKWWQEASEEEKRPFREMARLSKLEHQKLYPNYKYTPQKKTAPKRVYTRKNKNSGFTSRKEENNKVMKMIYEDPTALQHMNTSAATTVSNEPTVIKQESPEIKFEAINDSYGYYPSASPVSESSYENTVASPEIKYETIDDSCDYFSFVNPVSESSNENVIASPFTPSFEWDQFMCYPSIRTSSPYDILDAPCIDSINAYIGSQYFMDSYNYQNIMKPSYDVINPNLLHM